MAGIASPNRWRSLVWLIMTLGIVLTSCGTRQLPEVRGEGTQPAPTLAPVFRPGSGLALVPTPERSEPMSAVIAGQPSAERQEQFVEIVIYDEALHPDWSLEHSYGMRYDLGSSIYVHSGLRASTITPLVPGGDFLLTVKKEAATRYAREDIVGVSFWLNGGENYIDPGDLVSAVLGSNQYTYWIPDDPSVQLAGRVTQDNAHVFSPTRLYYLGINRPIPPGTWVEAINWLDERIFDPEYTYITGLYIRNDTDFLETIYVDKITLLIRR
jgi:hypothetical protein